MPGAELDEVEQVDRLRGRRRAQLHERHANKAREQQHDLDSILQLLT